MIKPAGWRVLIKPDPVEEKTESGIIINTEATIKGERFAQIYGTVVAIGSECWTRNGETSIPWCEVGDRVTFAKYSGLRIKEGPDGDELILINDEDITAVIYPEGE